MIILKPVQTLFMYILECYTRPWADKRPYAKNINFSIEKMALKIKINYFENVLTMFDVRLGGRGRSTSVPQNTRMAGQNYLDFFPVSSVGVRMKIS